MYKIYLGYQCAMGTTCPCKKHFSQFQAFIHLFSKNNKINVQRAAIRILSAESKLIAFEDETGKSKYYMAFTSTFSSLPWDVIKENKNVKS